MTSLCAHRGGNGGGCPGDGEEEEEEAVYWRSAVYMACFLFFCQVQSQFLLFVMQMTLRGLITCMHFLLPLS